jgi:hypothetical protein
MFGLLKGWSSNTAHPPLPAAMVDPKLDRPCFIFRDTNGQALAYVYFENEPGRRAAAKLLTRDEARRIAANIAKLPRIALVDARPLDTAP